MTTARPPEAATTAKINDSVPELSLEEAANSQIVSYMNDFKRDQKSNKMMSYRIDEGDGRKIDAHVDFGNTVSEPVAGQYFSFGKNSVAFSNHIIPNCLLDAPTLLIFSTHGVLPASRYLAYEDTKAPLATNRPVARALHRTKSALGFNRGYRNYYHWMLQCLPAIYSYFQECVPAEELVILVPHLNRVQQRSIDLLSCVKKDNFIDPKFQYVFGELRYSDFLSGVSSYCPSPLIKTMARQMMSTIDTQPRRGQGEVIYVSRVDTKNRIMVNEKDLIAKLTESGIDIVTLDGLDLDQQIDIFRNAKLVIGPHGAGLTNIIFSPEGSILYELFPRHYINSCYGEVAFSCGIHYWVDIFETLAGSDAGHHQREWTVDIGYVVARIDEIRQYHDI